MSSSKTPSKVDVLIVGAGPAGLCCANALAIAGVNVRIVDQKPSQVLTGQADGVMPRTIEILQSYGLADALLKQSGQSHMVAMYNSRPEGGIARTMRVPMINETNARYSFAATLNQGAIEDIFIDSMAKHGVNVERGIRPSSLVLSEGPDVGDPNAYPVKVVLSKVDKTGEDEEVHARFVLGADGAHSWVRKALGIAMEGEQTDHAWGAIDFTTTPDSNFPDWRNLCTIGALNTTIMSIPREADKVRLYVELGLEGDVIDKATGRVDKKNFNAERLIEIAKKAYAPYILTPKEIDWWTVYIVGQRIASKFSVSERVFIAGDACHTHSPKGGQGMNVSINDAHNLAWKLATVLRGHADLSLLKTYEEERRAFAEKLIAFDKWYEAGFSAKARADLFNVGANAKPVEPFDAFRQMSGLTSGIRVEYAPSTVISSNTLPSLKELKVGQRIPPITTLRAADSKPVNMQDVFPSDSRFKILVFTGDIADKAQLEKVEKLAAHLTSESGVLGLYGAETIDVVSAVKGKKEVVEYTAVPAALRSYWTKVLIDDTDATGKLGGKLYETYGVEDAGALVVVRPDAFVALAVPLDDLKSIDAYFAGFLKKRALSN